MAAPVRRLGWLLVLLLALEVTACGAGRAAPRTSSVATSSRSVPSPLPTTVVPATTAPPPATELAVPRPPIVWKPIPFPERRKEEMAAYALHHYGIDSYRLEHPQVIVEHYTVSTTFAPVYNEFSADVPDYELHELPGLCSHFVIDRDGTIYQLVPLDLMCRHTVGLNYTAIGIEMVGMSDRQILDDPRQLQAALSLTLWLMQRFGIQLRNVIGHSESLTSPFHKELVASLRCQTHGDWVHADMEVFRAKLAAMAHRYRMRTGPPATPVNTGC